MIFLANELLLFYEISFQMKGVHLQKTYIEKFMNRLYKNVIWAKKGRSPLTYEEYKNYASKSLGEGNAKYLCAEE